MDSETCGGKGLGTDVDDAEAERPAVRFGVPSALLAGVELALLAEAMLAGDGSIGGVRCGPLDPEVDCCSAAATAAAAMPVLASLAILSIARSSCFRTR